MSMFSSDHIRMQPFHHTLLYVAINYTKIVVFKLFFTLLEKGLFSSGHFFMSPAIVYYADPGKHLQLFQ